MRTGTRIAAITLGSALAASRAMALAPNAEEPTAKTDTRAERASDEATPPHHSEPSFLHQLGGDFRRTLTSRESLSILGVGGGTALLASPLDHRIPGSRFNSALHEGTKLDAVFDPGRVTGGALVQFGGALGTLAVGKLAGHSGMSELGADLVRAQVVSGTITQVLKLTIHRQRPDASSRLSFPSGHSTAAFATASVLEGRYGMKIGAPAYGVAAWIAASRLSENKHFLSDVAFGAAIGIAAGRSVAVRHGGKRLTLEPQFVAGGGVGIQLRLADQR